MDKNEKLREQFSHFVSMVFIGILVSSAFVYFFYYESASKHGFQIQCENCAKDLKSGFSDEIKPLSNAQDSSVEKALQHSAPTPERNPSQTKLRPLEIRWKAAASADTYRVKIWQKDQEKQVFLADTETNKNSIIVTPLFSSKLFWQVSILDSAKNIRTVSSIGEMLPK